MVKRVLVVLVMTTMLWAGLVMAGEDVKPAGTRGGGSGIVYEAEIVLASFLSLSVNHLQSMEGALEMAAGTSEAVSGDWAKIKPLLEAVGKFNASAVLWYARPDGSYYTVDQGLTKNNLKDREYFNDLLRGRHVRGPLEVSKSTGRAVTVIAVPIRKPGKDEIIGALGGSIYLDSLNEMLMEEMDVSPEVIFYTLTADTTVVHDWKPQWIMKKTKEFGGEVLDKAMREMMAAGAGVKEYELGGKMRKAVFRTSDYNGWLYAVGRLNSNE